MNVNNVTVAGRLGKDPELKSTQTGLSVCNFSVATNRKWKKDGVDNEETEWHNIVAFGKTAETIAQYLTKGREIYVEGRLHTNKWETKEGEKRYTTQIICNSFQFVGGRDSSQDVFKKEGGEDVIQTEPEHEARTKASYPSAEDEGINVEDIPF